jgi:hypothetical protein
MRLTKEFYNGCLIFIGIGVYFLLMNALGYANVFYLRLVNIVFIFYGVNRTLHMNYLEGKNDFLLNVTSAMVTSLIGVFLSIIGLAVFSFLNGGDSYIRSLSKSFLFGGNPTIMTYCITLLFEGIASSVIVTFLLIIYRNNRYTSD